MSVAVAFEEVTKGYRLGRLRMSPRLAVPGSFGDRLGGEVHRALHDVSFTVGEGDSLGIIGHNGAGKSTLLKLVAGVITPTSGRVTVVGRTAALIELGAGFHPEMTGRENISFSAAVLGMGRRRLRELLPEIIEFAEIDDYLDTPIKRYSSGMLARLGFAVASHLDADVLVIDEVLSVGDSAFQRKCYERIAARRADGASVLYVTHAMWTVPVVCQRALLLERGRVVASGEPDDVVRTYLEGLDAPGDEPPATGLGSILRRVRMPSSVEPGNPLSVEIDLVHDRPCPNGSMIVSLLSPSGTVFGTASTIDSDVSFERSGRFSIRCDLESVPLVPGDYELYVVFRADHSQPVVDDLKRLPLRVEGPDPDLTMGAVALRATWDRHETSAD
jgi:ABC-type polysaccharide/polyol phosphate transport system ATPase subunit